MASLQYSMLRRTASFRTLANSVQSLRHDMAAGSQT